MVWAKRGGRSRPRCGPRPGGRRGAKHRAGVRHGGLRSVPHTRWGLHPDWAGSCRAPGEEVLLGRQTPEVERGRVTGWTERRLGGKLTAGQGGSWCAWHSGPLAPVGSVGFVLRARGDPRRLLWGVAWEGPRCALSRHPGEAWWPGLAWGWGSRGFRGRLDNQTSLGTVGMRERKGQGQ